MTPAGAHGRRIADCRALADGKGRREQGRFAFEGATLLAEAHAAGILPLEIFATVGAARTTPLIAELEGLGSAVFTIDERSLRRLSQVETPSGIVAVAPTRYAPLGALLSGGLTLLLADLNDPGNAGTLLRSAEAFGARGAVFGSLGVDPYHPKVVRAAMGALFRLPVTVAEPSDLVALAARGIGLDAAAPPLEPGLLADAGLLVVGHERSGLGRWRDVCERMVAIPMAGHTESLNAAVAGSIALYQAARDREGRTSWAPSEQAVK